MFLQGNHKRTCRHTCIHKLIHYSSDIFSSPLLFHFPPWGKITHENLHFISSSLSSPHPHHHELTVETTTVDDGKHFCLCPCFVLFVCSTGVQGGGSISFPAPSKRPIGGVPGADDEALEAALGLGELAGLTVANEADPLNYDVSPLNFIFYCQ